MSTERNYWLFMIMYDDYPESWKKMVEKGIAAQQYPPNWGNETKNINALRKLKKGDCIVAGFRKHEFAGYAYLKSDFYRGGESLNIKYCDDDGHESIWNFEERCDVDWHVFPFDDKGVCIKCGDLKKKGFKIDFQRGLCVKQIDEASFYALKKELDKKGVVKHQPENTDCFDDVEEHLKEYSGLNETERKAIIKSRIGQGIFRENLIRLWNFCSVTGISNLAILKASHIKPWSVSSNEERLDQYNGLLLIPNLDTLFDRGLITFGDDGGIIISRLLSEEDRDKLNIGSHLKIGKNEPPRSKLRGILLEKL